MAGNLNARADALSRKPEYIIDTTEEPRAILKREGNTVVYNRPQIASTSRLKWNSLEDQIRSKYPSDPVVREQEKQLGSGFSWNPDRLLLFKNRTYIPTNIRTEFIREQHELPAHGH